MPRHEAEYYPFNAWSLFYEHVTLNLTTLTDQQLAELTDLISPNPNQRIVDSIYPRKIGEIDSLIFEWGDPRIPTLMSGWLEWDPHPGEKSPPPFIISAVIGTSVWVMDIKPRAFDPKDEKGSWLTVPYDNQEAADTLEAIDMDKFNAFGDIGGVRWVQFTYEASLVDTPAVQTTEED